MLEEVISVLNLDMETEELAKKITVTTPTDTRVMSINVEDPQPKQAKRHCGRGTSGSQYPDQSDPWM